ncbi:hypothetical protein [Solibacillus sp. FSL K6-1554]|uniref:hypothetical protein n=1 Tax=Solibacillus sp. FSL K6-1554 TaxID=2921472 RepID=UPI0030FA7DE1
MQKNKIPMLNNRKNLIQKKNDVMSTIDNNDVLEMKKKDTAWSGTLKPIKPASNRSISKGGCLGVVNNSNSKRSVVSKEIIRKFGCPDKILCSIDEDKALVLSVCTEDSSDGHTLRGKDVKNVIYSAALVEKITEIFELDFSNCTSQTVGNVEYVTVEDRLYAYITK